MRDVTNLAHLARQLLRCKVTVLVVDSRGLLLCGYQGRNFLLALPAAQHLEEVDLWRGSVARVDTPEQALRIVGVL